MAGLCSFSQVTFPPLLSLLLVPLLPAVRLGLLHHYFVTISPADADELQQMIKTAKDII